jgi:hypothetical protein
MNEDKRTKDEMAVLALACGATMEQAAQQAKLSKRTLYRRLSEPAFRRRVQAARAEMMQRTAGTAVAAMPVALKTLVELVKGGTSESVRLQAAGKLLDTATRLRESTDLEERVNALEEAQQGEASPS